MLHVWHRMLALALTDWLTLAPLPSWQMVLIHLYTAAPRKVATGDRHTAQIPLQTLQVLHWS